MKSTIISVLVSLAFIGGIFVFAGSSDSKVASTDNVRMENGKQIITVTAKGKYTPGLTAAKAGISSVLRMETNGTYDCTAGLTIPSLGYRAFLPPSGSTDIEIPTQKVGASVKGVCTMGMYNFEITFN